RRTDQGMRRGADEGKEEREREREREREGGREGERAARTFRPPPLFFLPLELSGADVQGGERVDGERLAPLGIQLVLHLDELVEARLERVEDVGGHRGRARDEEVELLEALAAERRLHHRLVHR